jgi:hypothetical protein
LLGAGVSVSPGRNARRREAPRWPGSIVATPLWRSEAAETPPEISQKPRGLDFIPASRQMLLGGENATLGRSEALSRDHRVPTRCSNQPCGLPAEWLLVPQLETQLCSHTRLCIGNAAPGDETAGLGCLRHQQLLNVRLQGVDGLHE